MERDDDGLGDPAQIAEGILVNHFGTPLTCEPVVLRPAGYLDIGEEKDWSFSGGDCRTVSEFQKKYVGDGSTEICACKNNGMPEYKDTGR